MNAKRKATTRDNVRNLNKVKTKTKIVQVKGRMSILSIMKMLEFVARILVGSARYGSANLMGLTPFNQLGYLPYIYCILGFKKTHRIQPSSL